MISCFILHLFPYPHALPPVLFKLVLLALIFEPAPAAEHPFEPKHGCISPFRPLCATAKSNQIK
jgi:hypothetical protein